MPDRRYFATDYLEPPRRRDEVKPKPKAPYKMSAALAAGTFFAAIGGSAYLAITSQPGIEAQNKTVFAEFTPEATVEALLVTDSQEYAKKLLEDPFVIKLKNVTVWGDIKEKDYKEGEAKVYIANMRDKPYSYRTKTQQAGKIVGELPRGTMIAEAVVVVGNNPHFADRGDDAKGRWVAYLNPQDPAQVVFSYAENFRGQGVDFFQAIALGPQGLTR